MALPGKVENLTPPANGKNAPDGAPPAAPVQPDQVQPEPLRLDQCQRQQPGTGTGSRPPPPTICTGMHPAQQIAPPVQTEGQSSSAQRAAALAFFFCPSSTPCRLPALPDQQQTDPARCPRRPPDDHASAPPPQQITPPTCTTCQQQTSTSTSAAPMTPQPISCTACPLPTASSQQRQTSQQPAPAACTYQQHQRTPKPCRLPAAADQHHPRPPNGPKPAHRGPLPEGSDSLPDRHIDFAV